MGSGTRSECKRRWTPEAHRPKCRMKLGYEFCYLYAALNPFTGALFSLILPDMTKESFSLFSEHFSKYLNKVYGYVSKEAGPGKVKDKVLLIADGAGAHQAQVCAGVGVDFTKLPTACPELNPVERFFEELRKELSNHVFEGMAELEKHLIAILKKYYKSPQTIISLAILHAG